MKYCPNRRCPVLLEMGIPSEFRDDVEVCPDCGTPLAEGEAPPLEPDTFATGDLKTLCTVQSLEDAEYLQESLAYHDVSANILERAELEARGLFVDEIGDYGLVVLESEYVRANRILDLILDEGEEDVEDEEDDDEFDKDEEDPDDEAEEWEDEEAPSGEVLVDLLHRFAACDHSWFATVRPDGRPHLTPVWHVLHNGLIYISTQSQTVKVANVQTNPQVAIAANEDDPDDGLLIEGTASLRSELRDELSPLFAEKYEWLVEASPYHHDVLLEITPTKLIAWGQYGEGRWLGDEIRAAAADL